ncbi:MAG: transglycosylase SLT domain-containing protein [Rhizobiales bacterium]|nr:transglycosylase SLT domain-containing protein [Hyphomicrobiales bacterium]
MVLAFVLQGCTQSSLSQNDLVSSNALVSSDTIIELEVDELTHINAFVKTQKISTSKTAGNKALEWQQKWKERVAKRQAEHKQKIAKVQKLAAKKVTKKSTKKTTKKVIKKVVAVSRKPQKLKGKGRARYTALITKYAQAYGVPVRLAHAVVQVESNFRANARGGVGEIGLMQLRLATARGIGYKGSAKALYNPETNIKYGMKYLGKAYKLGGGTTCGAILKYNAGHGAKRMNRISANYCRKVKRII